MKKIIGISILLCISIHMSASAQNVDRTPSYKDPSWYISDHPGEDVNVFMYFNSWKNSEVQNGHGGFHEQAIFTPGDPMNPPRKGACLKYIHAYDHGILYSNEKTIPTKHSDEQVVFYILKGFGRVEAGGKSANIQEGTAILIPAGLEYSFVNTTGIYLEVIIIVEGVSADFKPLKDMVVKSYYDETPGYWGGYATYELFNRKNGLAEPMNIAVCTMDTFAYGTPHYTPGCEEVWCKIKGEKNLLILGKTLLWQDIGEAWYTPNDSMVPHSVINHTETPMAWIYFANYRDREK